LTYRVLLVEDEPLIQEALGAALLEAGLEPACVSSGEEALTVLASQPPWYSALVTDINLGGAPSGWQVADRARELLPNVAVVYISGHGEAVWGSRGVPGSRMLRKPFSPSTLAGVTVALLTTSA
jgi:CheY-like chemotaxis protein